MSEAAARYFELLVRSQELTDQGKEDSPEADEMLSEMDHLWWEMSEGEQDRVRHRGGTDQ